MWNAILLSALGGADLAPARVELLVGRSDIADERGIQSLVGGGQALDLEGPAYLEIGPASRLAVRWRQEASLDLRGSAALEWRAPRDGRGVLITAWRVTELDFEVRRGPLRIDLSGGWRVELEFGAAGLRTLADGRLEVRHIAGAPLLLFCSTAPGLVSPPWTVLPGAVVRLDAAARRPAPADGFPSRIVAWPGARPASNPSGEVPTPAWTEFAWPWIAGIDAPRTRAALPMSEASPSRVENARIAPAAVELQTIEVELPDRLWSRGAGQTLSNSVAASAPEEAKRVEVHNAPTNGEPVAPSRALESPPDAATILEMAPLQIVPPSIDWFEFRAAPNVDVRPAPRP